MTPVPTRAKVIGMTVELVKTPAPERAGARRKAAKSGHALSDGSFPIPNVAYLKKAIRAVGRAAAGKRPALARLIRKRGRELGATNIVNRSWAGQRTAKAMSNALRGEFELAGMDPEQIKIELAATQDAFVLDFARSKRTQSTTAVQTAANQVKLEGSQPGVKRYSSTAAAAARKHTSDAQRDRLKQTPENQADHALYQRVHASMRQRGMSNTQAHRLATRAVKLRRGKG